MTLLLNLIAVLGSLLVLWLLYLFLFERGASYRTSAPLHELLVREHRQSASLPDGGAVCVRDFMPPRETRHH